MRKNTIAVMLAIFACGGILLSDNNGPSGDYTGAPLSNGNKGVTCAVANCHLNTADLGGSVDIAFFEKGQTTPLTTFKNGVAYTVQITVGSTSSIKKGFEATVLNPTHTNVGTLSTPGSGVKIKTWSGRSCAEHSTPSSLGVWTFVWTAPASGSPDSITIYAAGNASNNSNTAAGDDIRTNKKVIYLDPSASVSVPVLKPMIFPNPVSSQIQISEIADRIEILDITGNLVSEERITQSVDVSTLPIGIYFIKMDSGKGSVIHKFQKI